MAQMKGAAEEWKRRDQTAYILYVESPGFTDRLDSRSKRKKGGCRVFGELRWERLETRQVWRERRSGVQFWRYYV